ncbi:MAG: OmpH family outer membrane protein [Thermodesulfobacteriota bacterium]
MTISVPRWLMLLAVALIAVLGTVDKAPAADLKIGTVDVQKILDESSAGQEAHKALEAKRDSLRASLETEQGTLEKLKDEIEKQKSVWSEEARLEKERAFQKRLAEFKMKNDDAAFELETLRKKLVEPMFTELRADVAKVAKAQGFHLIFDIRGGLLFADDSFDVSTQVRKALDERMKQSGGSKK